MDQLQDQPLLPASAKVDFYDATYAHFDQSVYRDIRSETWDEDFGQNGWITAREQDEFISWLALTADHRLLDIACGSGGPTLRIAEKTAAFVVGLDVHAAGIANGQQEAAARGLAGRAQFKVHDAQKPLPFADGSFNAVTCIDAINHLSDRAGVLAEWARVLKPGGMLLFTDPCVVAGPLTSDEIAIRASLGFFLFVAPDTNDRMLAEAGLQITKKEDLSEALARSAHQWHVARHERRDALRELEGDQTFEGQQRFFQTAACLARQRRLVRLAYLSRKVV